MRDQERSGRAHIRVLPELRSEQVQRHGEFVPSEGLYFTTSFDLVGIEVPPGLRRTTLVGAMARIATSRSAVLELPEPLWARFLPRAFCLAATWTLTGVFRGRLRRARTYAIENNDPIVALLGDRPIQPRTAVVTRAVVGVLTFLMYERIAFGSPSAAATYESLPLVRRLERRTFLELPGRPPTPPDAASAVRSAAFVGALMPRKGVPTLLDAWGLVEQRCPDAELHLIGSGPLEGEVAAWAAAEPARRHFHGHLPQRDVLKLLPSFSVLAAPSIRWGRWREQIGLPIKEGLRSGLTVVTTSETGLAPWLAAHGHHILSPSPTAEELSSALVQALDNPLPRARVLADLPEVSARREADEWLHSPTA